MRHESDERRSLVTGGAGFIGSHLVERLLARGDRVTVIDDFSTGRLENLDPARSRPERAARLRVIHREASAALPLLDPRDFDEIYHLAAAVGVRLVIEEPIRTIETNVHEASAVLRFAAEARVPLLMASTSEVYGKSTKPPFSEDDDVTYGPTIYSRWSYACSKAIDEYLSLAYHAQHRLPVVIVRFFNTVGPRQIGRYGMVLPRFVKAALRGEPLEVHGDGRQSRCFCDVRDVAPALMRLVADEALSGRVVNLGNDQPITILALAELVKMTLESSSPIRLVPYEEAFAQGFDDLLVRQPDLRRVRAAIGFRPEIPLTQTILDIAAEARARPEADAPELAAPKSGAAR
ncbi:MAG: GDP-mannose 4,6-dehydratase [Phycisphaerales bacterium]